MNGKPQINYFVKFVITILMTFCLVYPLNTSLSFSYRPSVLIGIIILFLAVQALALFNKFTLKISIAVFIASVIIATVYSFYHEFFYELLAFKTWLINYANGSETLNATFELAVILVLCFVISLLTYIFSIKRFNFYIIASGGIAIYVTQWILNFFDKRSFVTFYLFIFLTLIYYFMHVYHKNSLRESNDYAQPPMFIIWSAPVCLIIIITAYFMPASSKPIEWKWMDKKVNAVYTKIVNNFNNYNNFEFFSLSSTGFGSDSRLGGKVKLNKTVVLKVDSPRVVYLKGSCNDLYTGSKWENTKKTLTALNSSSKDLSPLYFDNWETKLGLLYLYQFNYAHGLDNTIFPTNMGALIDRFSHYDKIKVTFQNINTKSLFVPIKSDQINTVFKKPLKTFVNTNGALSNDIVHGKGFTYSFNTRSFNYRDTELIQLLSQSRKGMYTDIEEKLCKDVIDGLVTGILANVSTYTIDNNSSATTVNGTFYADDNFLNPVEALEDSSIHLYTNKDDFDLFKRVIQKYHNQFSSKIIVEQNPISGDSDSSYIMIKLNDQSNVMYSMPLEFSSIRQLSKNAEYNYANYLQLPAKLPKRVYDLAKSVTSSKSNNYEKVKALEQYLSSNFTYTLDPPSTPKNRDFVDYFLFDGKKGYCTYYATSLVVLARCLGIPARYVEGYILPAKPASGTLYNVTNEQAHAWVEVYFEGFGWIPFEPTAPYAPALYGKPETPQTLNFANNIDLEYAKRLAGYSGMDDIPVSSVTPVTPVIKQKSNVLRNVILAVLLTLFLIFMVIVLFNVTRSKTAMKKITQKDPRACVLLLYKHLIKLLFIQGCPIHSGETPYQYSDRMGAYLDSNSVRFSEVTNIFVKARYSQMDITIYDKRVMIEFYDSLMEKTRNRLGKYKYFLYKFILGKV